MVEAKINARLSDRAEELREKTDIALRKVADRLIAEAIANDSYLIFGDENGMPREAYADELKEIQKKLVG